jgi:hypothetical protein
VGQVLEDPRTPSRATLAGALAGALIGAAGALIGAAVITLLPVVAPGLLIPLPGVPPRAYPLIGAIPGYLVR